MKNESVLDNPKQDLDSSVWIKSETGDYVLTEEANSKIENIVSWVLNILKINNLNLNITGSITSNQYSEKSDVDLHFNSPSFSEEKIDNLNRVMRELFEDEYKQNNDTKIGTHEIEIYFQINPYQDMMSIGCYDFFKKEWIVGPELLPQDYDPYSEFYNDDMQYINSIISDIRNVILEIYELVVVLNNTKDEEFKEYEFQNLVDKLAKASQIFTQAREFRKIYSSPSSKEDALTKRSSRKWKIADSSFKLMDKFGYLGILREMTRAWEQIQNKNNFINMDQVISRIINVIQDNIMKNPNLQNVDKELFESLIDENVAKNLSTLALIVSMIAIPGLTNAKGLERDLRKIPTQEMRMANPKVTKAINKNSMENKKFNGLSFSNLTNLISTIAYNEGMIDYIKPNAKGKKYDDRILQAIIWTIINRADKDPNKYAQEIARKSQYYSFKHVIGGIKDDDYIMYHPGMGYSKRTWDKCNEFAVMAINGTLPMPVDDNGVKFGNRNMIANKVKDNKDSYDAWGRKCDWTVGGRTLHCFGYDPHQDRYSKKGVAKTNKNTKTNTVKTYKIKKGDSLYKIAKKFKTTTDKILAKNPQITNPNKIKIGQKLKI